jgi:Asp/Glu/hydantoin racemase
MKKFNVALIRVVTLTDEDLLNKHAEILSRNYSGFEIETFCISEQNNGIYNEETHLKSIPKIIELAENIADNFDGIFISCAADPAVEELKKNLNIAVEGAGRASAIFSQNFGDKIAVLGMGNYRLSVIEDQLADKLFEYKFLEEIKNTHDFSKEDSRNIIKEAVLELQNKGADAVLMACTGIGAMEIAVELNKELSIPVIDPIITGGLFLYGQLLLGIDDGGIQK